MQCCRLDATQKTLFLPAVFAPMKSITTAQASTGDWQNSGVNASRWEAWVVCHSLEKWDSEPTVITCLKMEISLFSSLLMLVFHLMAWLASSLAQDKLISILLAELPLAHLTLCKSFLREMVYLTNKPFSQPQAPSICNSLISSRR
jgi:hypothetical protein